MVVYDQLSYHLRNHRLGVSYTIHSYMVQLIVELSIKLSVELLVLYMIFRIM